MTWARWVIGWFALVASATAFPQGPIVIKFSHLLAPDTPKGKGALRFKVLAEVRTKGAVRIEVYPNGELAKDGEEIDALQRHAVQMLAPPVSKLGLIGVREFEAFDLPYMILNRETLYRITDGEVGRRLFAKLETKGIKGLAYWDNGFKQMSANRPLRKLDDFRGLKMQIQPSKVLEDQMRALRARPRAMPCVEAYAALRKGVVEGTETTLSNFYSQKSFELQRHLTLSEHGYLLYAVVVNKRFWEGLPPTIRTALEGALADATEYERAMAKQDDEAALAAIKAANTTEVYVLPAEERKRWTEALRHVHQRFASVVGGNIIEAMYAAQSAPR